MTAARASRFPIVSVILILVLCAMTACGSGSSTAAVAGPTFKNPVYSFDFPDPYVLQVGKMYYAYATNGNSKNVQELKSSDLVHWTENGDAMPIQATWFDKDIWAPTVLHRQDGKYVMYYAAHSVKNGGQCLGRAVAASPAGPFKDTSKAPFLCQTKRGGTIDPDVFRDDNGNIYLYYKNDGNCCGLPTYLWAQRLSADGLKLIGKPNQLMYNTQAWERDVTEAPSMWKHGGKYYLFFSAAHWDSSSYSVGYAACKGPMGPCAQDPKNPILEYHFGGCNAEGPGGQAIVADAKGQTWIVYHAWVGDAVGYGAIGGKRALWLDRLDWKDGKPVITGPICKAESGPVMKT